MMKRFLLAAMLLAAFSLPAQADGIAESSILKPITGSHRMPFDATSRRITGNLSSGGEVARLTCSTACFVQIGISGSLPVAIATGLTASTYLPADRPEYFLIPNGAKIAVIRLSTDGVLFVQEMSR